MVRRTLALVAALVATLFAFTAVPAHAGGPTSVLLSSPPHVTAVGYDDQRYYDLQELVQTAPKGDTADPAHEAGRFVRATWLIHDMTVWRIDIIYPDAPGGPWISTQEFNGTTPSKITWHLPTDPARLRGLLDSFKLLDAKFDGGPTLDDGYSGAAEPVTTPAPTQAVATASTSLFTGWRWIIPGVLVGALTSLVGVRLLPKRRDWQLTDVE
ncbi:hypothetical protein [Kribbella kalugense]|uniref:Uncharacterized protein n=1 Tax=Kribbella kalugense TaxID=2512221 RepID=A0A4R7ZXX1_9ACTN|nr:hypothetical protein [Kribbella kalugense]TDW22969.1 hypothetical protein EV650_1817 [Kribbella kalugense]